MMVRTELPKAYRQRLMLFAVAFHFLLVASYYGFGRRYVSTFYQLPAHARPFPPAASLIHSTNTNVPGCTDPSIRRTSGISDRVSARRLVLARKAITASGNDLIFCS